MPRNRVLWPEAYLPVQEKLSGCCVWTSSSRNYVAKIFRDAIRSRKYIAMKRISAEIRDLQELLV